MVLRTLDRLWFSAPVAAVRQAVAQAGDLIAPSWCVGCRAPGTQLCPSCTRDLRLMTRRPFRADEPAEALPLLDDLTVLPVLSAAAYETLVADAVLAFKDHERTRLSRVLAPALERAVSEAAELCRREEVLLLWPPPHPRSQLARGRHPLGELVTQLRLPDRVVPAGHMVRHRLRARELVGSAMNQKARSQRGRRRAEGSFMLASGAQRRLVGAQVLLVDDVLTTGATLASLWRLLDEAGADVPAAAVLAATPR